MKETQNNRKEEVKRQILDAFFTFRRNLPEDGYIQQNRTTEEIWDDLRNMYNFTYEEIADYLIDHNYSPVTEQDGSVKWAVWRLIHE